MALARVSREVRESSPAMVRGVEFHKEVVEGPTSKSRTKSVTTRTGIEVSLERRPTVDRAWVVCAYSDEMMIDMEVMEGGEDREKALDSMVKRHGGAR